MTAVHVQLREDAELGAAWRRAEAVMPDQSTLNAIRDDRGVYFAGVYRSVETDSDSARRVETLEITTQAATPADALNALADALEARRAAE